LAGFLDLVVDCGVFLIAGWRVAGPVRLPWGRPGPGRLVCAALVIHRQLLAEATKTRRIRLGVSSRRISWYSSDTITRP
jgi:hypothetical protein